MKLNKKVIAIAVATIAGATTLSSCGTDAQIASTNLSKAADQFEISRRIVFFNGITDKYLLEIDGKCSVETSGSKLDGSLEVTCKTGPNAFKKHYLGLSDNVSYFVQQIDAANVSTTRYRVIFKPAEIVPDINLVTK
jgi:hypothetical protein